MAKRFCCWVIVSGGQPTAFRSRDAESLLPTLRQLQRTQPDSMLKWFDRGQLWTSPSEADAALRARRQTGSARGHDWRPGGTHADPKAKYQLTRDQKRARFKRRLTQRPDAKPDPEPGNAAKRDRSAGGNRPDRRPPSDRRPGAKPDRWPIGVRPEPRPASTRPDRPPTRVRPRRPPAHRRPPKRGR